MDAKHDTMDAKHSEGCPLEGYWTIWNTVLSCADIDEI